MLEFLPLVLSGVTLTISLALTSVVVAIVCGLIGAAMKLSSVGILRILGGTYTTVVRGIPDLVLMLLVFFGGQILINSIGDKTGLWTYVEVSPFWAGSLSIGFIFGAYMTETFRGAFLAVPNGQIEAAKAVGLAPRRYLLRVVWPQMVPHALPNFTNNWLVLMKTTALVSIIGLQDVVYNANQAGRTSQEPLTFLVLTFFIFLGLTLLSDIGLRKIGRVYAIREN
ncbi:ABC transporter permease subunit [Cognatishimia sp. 1_MG-2023]|uniref:ABC transporter permease n=1 Tax=Cognatishimia sp. 1_MG-2023 TaxID=3062642 RepID=UPI0026E31C2E|nr:ABC transporter permease subunit [Cognatishimia sp. 1_MG-2023]MDO6728250.1 ABC transporter permease subunit [Cognatishimia sp. 1_MG-2023]